MGPSSIEIFLEAARRGEIAVIQGMYEDGASLDCRGSTGDTAMHRASLAGHAHLVNWLLARGASPDLEATDYLRYTPFIWACSLGHEGVVAALVGVVNLDARGRDGEAGLDKARRYGHRGVEAVILAHLAREAAREALSSATASHHR